MSIQQVIPLRGGAVPKGRLASLERLRKHRSGSKRETILRPRPYPDVTVPNHRTEPPAERFAYPKLGARQSKRVYWLLSRHRAWRISISCESASSRQTGKHTDLLRSILGRLPHGYDQRTGTPDGPGSSAPCGPLGELGAIQGGCAVCLRASGLPSRNDADRNGDGRVRSGFLQVDELLHQAERPQSYRSPRIISDVVAF